jgi:hypothetical protein
LAHRVIWEDFVWRGTVPETSTFSDGILIVFEDDVFPRVENYGEATLEEVSKMHTDLLFLGWCMATPNQNVTPPYCTHAYAVSYTGAKKLLDSFIPCGPSIDVQFIALAHEHKITWDYVSPESYAFQVRGNGRGSVVGDYFNIGDDTLAGDGIFAQRSFTGT